MRIVLRAFLILILGCAVALPASAEFLWEVIGVTNRIYLYGTVHAGKADWFPLPAPVEQAFNESKVLVVEADITDESAMAKYGGSMTYAPPDSLKAHVDAADYERFRKLLARNRFPEGQVGQMKPLMAVSLLVFAEWAREGLLARYGVDQYLIMKAKSELKPVVEIEGIASQMRLMDSLTEKESQTIFSGTLQAIEEGLAGEQISALVKAWQRGEPDTMLTIARAYNDRVKGAAEFEEKFIWSRHEDMLNKIAGYLNDSRERHFVAVGSLHLAGPRGLLEMLRKRGYIVRQM
ncbi:MAG: TraB/GumN family protein [Usitatibacter sp.]